MHRKRNLVANIVAASELLSVAQRVRLLRRAGLDLGDVDVRGGCFFQTFDVSIADGAFVNRGCYFGGRRRITLESGVYLADQVMLHTGSHEIGGPDCRAGAHVELPVTVGRGTWIGARATVLPGVTIGAGCVIGAGSVVTGVLEPNTVYAGVPARPIRTL